MTPNPSRYNGLPICSTMSPKWRECRNWARNKAVPAETRVLCRRRGANCGYSGYVGEHYEGGERMRPGRTGLWERVPRIFVLHRVTADQAEALRVWSAVGVLAVLGVLGLWEAWRCQWAAAENTQSFRNHWQVYRGLVPADSAFSDLKWRESFLSLKSLLHPTVQRSKTIRHHKQTDTKEHIITHHHSCKSNSSAVKYYAIKTDFKQFKQ